MRNLPLPEWFVKSYDPRTGKVIQRQTKTVTKAKQDTAKKVTTTKTEQEPRSAMKVEDAPSAVEEEVKTTSSTIAEAEEIDEVRAELEDELLGESIEDPERAKLEQELLEGL